MRYCTNCGHKLGVGRYCTNCGARVVLPATDIAPPPQGDYPTIVRAGELPPVPTFGPAPGTVPAAPPPPPPPLAGPPPSSARYPLFADAVQAPAGPAPAPPAPPAATASYDVVPARRRSVVPWLIAFLVLAVLALTGGALLLLQPSGDKEPNDVNDGDPRGTSQSETRDTTDPPAGEVSTLEPTQVAVPATAPASADEDGNRVTFQATNMLDGDPRTSWRMAGDGSGSTINLQFEDPVTVTEVGLVNGYAKTDPPHDWYGGNRRITSVVWVFDDGTEVNQDLRDDNRELQTAPVSGVETTSVELRIVDVTEPGSGPDARDYTAVSEIAITGVEVR